jgi:hypothetical protein
MAAELAGAKGLAKLLGSGLMKLTAAGAGHLTSMLRPVASVPPLLLLLPLLPAIWRWNLRLSCSNSARCTSCSRQ